MLPYQPAVYQGSGCVWDLTAAARAARTITAAAAAGLPGMDVLSMLRCQHVVDAITGVLGCGASPAPEGWC